MCNDFSLRSPLATPVLFLIYKRPETTERVFNAIRMAKPQKLFIAADGPKRDLADEVKACQQVRKIATAVDWDCEVKTLFRDENLGCRKAVSSSITWFFENESDGIILEDDCLPSQSFFRFCQDLLEYYREDRRIMAISGNNFQKSPPRNEFSYYFSRFSHCWGWASWRRAWTFYDIDMTQWPYIRDNGYLEDILLNRSAVRYWRKIFENSFNNKIDTWDYQWMFSGLINNALTILPNQNLVSNIGFVDKATHTIGNNNPWANLPRYEIPFPLKHPAWVIRDNMADSCTQNSHYMNKGILNRVLGKFIF